MENKKIKLLQIERLVDIIQSMNNAIQLHLGADKPDRLAIEQYQEIKQKAVQEMLDTLAPLDIAEPTIAYFNTHRKPQAA